MAHLIVEERGKAHHYPFQGNRVTIGRAPDNDIILHDEKSSRHHAVVELLNGKFRARDLESLNGTFINGLRIREQGLAFGETFMIGQARITIETEQATAIDTQATSKSQMGNLAPERPVREVTRSSKSATTETRRVAAASTETVEVRLDTLGTLLPKELTDTKFLQAIRHFDKMEIHRHVDRFLEAIANFVASLVPETRVCISTWADQKVSVVAFANFITSSQLDELPKNFTASVTRVVQSGKALLLTPTGEVPRLVVPLRTGDQIIGALYIEKSRSSLTFEPDDQRIALALEPFVASLVGLKPVIEAARDYRERFERLEQELKTTREELQKRLDLQTAELTRTRDDASRIGTTIEFRYDYTAIIGKSKRMIELFRMMDRITDLPVPILIIGEPGVGKELIARALHFNSKRAGAGQFVAENCAALPETLLESELFGHEKGAFTGADREKPGLFEMANKGTIFLDEIGETTPSLQAKLLRVLEESEVRRVGGQVTRKLDFRLVAATNRPLDEMVDGGNFRQDLFYRINVITIRVPPLRERLDDIPVLVDYFLGAIAEEAKTEKLKPTSGVLRALMEYHWPGNVRELENEVKRMVALCDGDKVGVEHLSPRILGEKKTEAFSAPTDLPLKELVEIVESRRIEEVLAETDGNKSKASEILGLSRLGLRKKMERYGIDG